MKKFYLAIAVGALSAVPLFAAEPAKTEAPAPAPKTEAPAKAEAPKAEAPKVDIWKLLPDVVATVDGKNITKAELIAHVKSMVPNGEIPPQVTPELIAQLAPGMIREMITPPLIEADFKANKPVVTKDEARKIMQEDFRGLRPDIQARFVEDLKKRNMTVDQFIEAQIAKPEVLDQLAMGLFEKKVLAGCEATDEDAKKYYDAHVNEFPEVVGASHILVQVKPDASEADKKAALDKINRIAEEVKKDPAKFGEIAAKESDCPSKARGGSLGEFRRRQMDPEFENAAFALKQGEISGVVKSSFGYHIIRCDAAPHRPTFEKAKRSIRMMLTEGKRQERINAYIEGLMKKHNVVILVKAPAMPAPAAPAEPAAPAAK